VTAALPIIASRIGLPHPGPSVLAFGAHLKSSI